jgi:hypothetical protein
MTQRPVRTELVRWHNIGANGELGAYMGAERTGQVSRFRKWQAS